MIPSTIAIDGPAAAGKSTLARSLAAQLGYLYFDTGVMYRAVTLAAQRAAIAVDDEPQVSAIAEQVAIDVQPASVPDGRQYDVLLDGEDVTWAIRSPEIDANVSTVSMYGRVRRAMTERQREIGRRGRVVMVGRDIGTVVLPEAELKIFLKADVEDRAQRRYDEMRARGEAAEYAAVLDAVQTRDQLDSTRDLAPLRPAADAIIVDSTDLDPQQVLERVLELVAELHRG
ncbi:MAG TPA: (d)CMP kinase [Anaerolineales bacterium]|nr:(d)CMP kinase [Anaerolineales bacterium]